MDFLDILQNSSEFAAEDKRSPLADYHLRNPIKSISWIDTPGSDRLSARTRKDKVAISNRFKAWHSGYPSELLYLEVCDEYARNVEVMANSISDVVWRIKVDRCLFKPSSWPIEPATIEACMKQVKLNLWIKMRFWQRVMIVMNALSSNRPLPAGCIERDGACTIAMSGSIHVLILRTCIALYDNDQQCVVYDGDWVRMTSDIFTQRFIVDVTSHIGRIASPEHYPDPKLIDAVIEWGDAVIRDLRNEAYSVIKTYEALMVGLIQRLGSAKVIDPSRFLKNTVIDLLNEDPRFYVHAQRLIDIVGNIDNVHHLAQLYGLHRIWGHPIVDAVKGMEKLMKIGQKNIIKDSSLAKDSGRMFKRLYCKEYKGKYGAFPEICEAPTLLATKLAEGDMSALDVRIHSLEEWDRIKFKQSYQLPETFNLSMIVADKAISPTRSELMDIIRSKRTVMDPEKRRGVRRWLEDTTLNPRAFLTAVNNGEFPDDHKIIGLTPKERELNKTPRMFSLMSHLMRVYVVTTEQMLSDHILKMFPQITMTDTLLDLTKKMYTTVRSQSSQGKFIGKKNDWASCVVCMSLDFEKWNGHMRKEMTSPVFTAIGDLFGLSELYNRTYDIFSSSYYYLADGSYLPNTTAGTLEVKEPFSFTNHQGGMEGLRQKGWTIFTVCGLETILSKYNCSYKIMGMGDNQVLQVTLYTKRVDERGRPTAEGLTELKQVLDDIFEDLIRTFTDAGLPLKPLETWMSEDLYLYGKIPIWQGVPLTMSLKKLMRTFSMSNEDIMTVENALGTVASNGLASTQAGPCCWTSYMIINLMQSICYQDLCHYHPLLGEGLRAAENEQSWSLAMPNRPLVRYLSARPRGTSDQMVRRLFLIMPRSLGGYNGTNIYECMMRGFPDAFSRDMAYLVGLIETGALSDHYQEIVTRWLDPPLMPEVNYSTLVEDVTAINILKPRAPSAGIRQLVSRFMSNGVAIRNEEFRQLMNAKNEELNRYLAECLCEGDEIHIRLIHDIYEATIFGYADSILNKVVKTATIQRLAIDSSDGSIFSKIERDEKNYYMYMIWRLSAAGRQKPILCSTVAAKEIRRSGWNKELRGVTTPYPGEYMIETDCGDTGVCSCSDGYISVHFPDSQLSNRSWSHDIGGNPPYLGSKTKEKVVIGTGGKVYSGEPLVRRPINLLKTINWFVPEESNAAAVIKACVQAVTNLETDEYQGRSEGSAGSEIHRYRDSSTSHGALTTSNYLYSTRFHISTDNFTRYSKGAENTDIHYQALFCYVVETCNMYVEKKLQTGDPMCKFKHFKQRCYQCVNKIPEDFRDFPSDKVLKVIPSQPQNSYLYADRSKIRVWEYLSPLSRLIEVKLDSAIYEQMTGRQKRMWLQDIVTDKIVRDIISGNTSADSYTSIGLMNVKSYEKTMYLKMGVRELYDSVMSRLWQISSWASKVRTSSSRTPRKEEVKREAINKLIACDNSGFLGLAMTFTWQETAERSCPYPEMTVPDTNPISFTSACECVRRNLISLLDRGPWSTKMRTRLISEDEKDNPLIYKIMLADWVSLNIKCVECIYAVETSEDRDICWTIRNLKCRYGHAVFDKMKRLPWLGSYVTIERLRKDCETLQESEVGRRESIPLHCPRFVIKLEDSNNLRCRPTVLGLQKRTGDEQNFVVRGSPYSLLMMHKLPTTSIYKCCEIYNLISKDIIGRGVFIVGDGLGTSSRVIGDMGASLVVASTLLEPDHAIPQTYVHNVSPNHIIAAARDRVNSSLMVNCPNDIFDKHWSREWNVKLALKVDICISDIELPKCPERYPEIIDAILQMRPWRKSIVKTYIYEISDFINQLGMVMRHGVANWALTTTKLRSEVYPECWWVLGASVPTDRQVLTVDKRILTVTFERIRQELNEGYVDDYISQEDAAVISRMGCLADLSRSLTRLRAWAVFPVIGCVLPTNGTFTSLFFYLQKSKRPPSVKLQRINNQLKLYESEYRKLKDVMFCMMVSMIGDIKERLRVMKESNKWVIEWKETVNRKYSLCLARHEDADDISCEDTDYIPILCAYMVRQRLTFSSVSQSCVFKPGRKRRCPIYFPVSVNSITSIGMIK
ncbi:TPA_asm: L [Nymphaea alba virus 1]|uniref:Replicase n=1 Tax=Nymphaea alba virus 1 TaxID=2793733 RepID=A0A8D9PGS3_9RHAB|nr:L [Nymphaea alba virus 1] [Nymphaea alba virus 1]DAF42345.1 TPA_asm: L [Nymphaea alba virus 1]